MQNCRNCLYTLTVDPYRSWFWFYLYTKDGLQKLQCSVSAVLLRALAIVCEGKQRPVNRMNLAEMSHWVIEDTPGPNPLLCITVKATGVAVFSETPVASAAGCRSLMMMGERVWTLSRRFPSRGGLPFIRDVVGGWHRRRLCRWFLLLFACRFRSLPAQQRSGPSLH